MWIWSSQQLRKSWEIAGLRSFRTTLLADHPTQINSAYITANQGYLLVKYRRDCHASLWHHISHREVAFLLMIPPSWTPTAENVSQHIPSLTMREDSWVCGTVHCDQTSWTTARTGKHAPCSLFPFVDHLWKGRNRAKTL